MREREDKIGLCGKELEKNLDEVSRAKKKRSKYIVRKKSALKIRLRNKAIKDYGLCYVHAERKQC